MKVKPTVIAILLTLCITGCTSSIKLTGYGQQVDEQHGLEVKLIGCGKNGALIRIKNTSNQIISINDHIFSMHIKVSSNEQNVEPCGYIYHSMNTNPRPDDFIIIGPGQTREVEVPIRTEKKLFHAIHETYEFERGIRYEVDLQLAPYFLNQSKETQEKILSEFKIPNYLNESLQMNSLYFTYIR